MRETFPDIDAALAAAFGPETECVPVYARNLSDARASLARAREHREAMLAAALESALDGGAFKHPQIVTRGREALALARGETAERRRA